MHRLGSSDWLSILAIGLATAAILLVTVRTRRRRTVPQALWQSETRPASPAICEDVPMRIVRRHSDTVEGLEIQYGQRSLVRAVRVGAMNCEHKELLLTMDAAQWNVMTNAAKQEVLAAARSTWAEKMCPSGPDIAYVVIQTDGGTIVGRADPSSVHVV